MADISFNPRTILWDKETGLMTRDGFLLLNSINVSVADATSEYVKVSATQTLTNKTIDGDNNTLSDIGTGSLKNKTGDDANVVTGTAATTGNLSMWNGDGDLVTASLLASSVVEKTRVQTLAGKTFGDPPRFPEYTVATLPSAVTYDNGVIIVSDETGGRTLATSDGTNWRRVSDGAIVS